MTAAESATLTEKPILVTGNAGFIGFHLARHLLEKGCEVVGVDNLDPYYDVSLKEDRLKILCEYDRFNFHRFNLVERKKLEQLFNGRPFGTVVHLAAQAGVRYSLVNPRAYLDSNFIGFFNIIEACRQQDVAHLVYASSSSVYGLNSSMPFSVHDNVDHPISLYAASKKSNELLAHSYSHLFGLPTTGLRFFTVYGPWGRPDMALFKFARAIYLGEPLTLYNRGEMERDFTYIGDIIAGIAGVMRQVAEPNPNWDSDHPDPGTSPAPFRVYNIGAGRQVGLRHFLQLIEENLGKKAIVELAPMQPGDVKATYADISDLGRDTGYQPQTPVEQGIRKFIDWFLGYYGDGREIPRM